MAGNSSVSNVFRAILPLGWEHAGRREPAVLFCLLGMNADGEEAPQPSGLACWSCGVAL